MLCRRSQRQKLNWERFNRLFERWVPVAHILHAYPSVRFDARIQGKSRMRQQRPYGSARAAANNGRPYREPDSVKMRWSDAHDERKRAREPAVE